MSNYELITIDDRFFDADTSWELPTVNGYSWLGQIDANGRSFIIAVDQCMDAIRDCFRSVPAFENGVLNSVILTDYEDRLKAELTALPYGTESLVHVFNMDLRNSLEGEIPGLVPAEDSDLLFLINTLGMIYRDFRSPSQEVLVATKEANLIAEIPTTTWERALAAMSVTAINMTALAKHGELQLTEARKASILAEMTRSADAMEPRHCRPEFVEAFRNSAIKLFSQAPTCEAAAPSAPSMRM